MKRKTLYFAIGCCAMMLLGSNIALGKAHVPINKVQVCKDGQTMTVSNSKLDNRLAKGQCRLPTCDFDNVFQTGDPCPTADENEDGFCDLPNARDPAATPLCFPLF